MQVQVQDLVTGKEDNNSRNEEILTDMRPEFNSRMETIQQSTNQKYPDLESIINEVRLLRTDYNKLMEKQ